MKQLTLIISMIILSLAAMAQGASISGRVIWKGTNETVPFAEVSIESNDLYTSADENGNYLIEGLEDGSYQLMARTTNGKAIPPVTVMIDEGKDVYMDIKMEEITHEIGTVHIEDDGYSGGLRTIQLKYVENDGIYLGKKTEVVDIQNTVANKSTNNSRQLFKSVAGLNIWESDGAGIQLGIGGRGLSPNRTSNFNTRQNGYDMSADALGYPESYYSPPSEAIGRIEVVRGAASLQYGTQFGGMINFRLKEPSKEAIEVNIRQTGGSWGLSNTFGSISGTKNNLSYSTFYQYKRGNGWRPNSQFNVHTAHTMLRYQVSRRLAIWGEYTFMNYVAQQPGGLTDMQFDQDPQQSFRERNWFKVRWNLAALNLEYKFKNNRTKLNVRNFALAANRSALGYLGPINRVDPLEERNLLVSDFLNFGNETRILHRYNLVGSLPSTLLVGVRYYHGTTDTKQGFGDAGSDANFEFINPDNLENSDYHFPSQNVAVFAENAFILHEKFSVSPGLRFEWIDTRSDGFYTTISRDLAGNVIFSDQIADDRKNSRAFLLAGIGASYKPKESMEVYANFSQNYRAINFNDMRIVNPNFRVDPNLKDETGYSLDLGFRGGYKDILTYDLSLFMLSYNDRIGAVIQTDSVLFNTYRYRTNISDSRNVGIETVVQFDLLRAFKANKKAGHLILLSNITIQDARYINSDLTAFEGKKVELVPNYLIKSGLSYNVGGFKASYLFSFTHEHFTDATNAVYTANAVNGVIPSYYVMDLSFSYKFKKFVTLETGVNNLTNNKYFTRRAEGYPGPGIIPSDGISFYATIGATF